MKNKFSIAKDCELVIEHENYYYYIVLAVDYNTELQYKIKPQYYIAETLDIPNGKYNKIIKRHNGYYLDDDTPHAVFNNEEDINEAINEIISYIMISRLTN